MFLVGKRRESCSRQPSSFSAAIKREGGRPAGGKTEEEEATKKNIFFLVTFPFSFPGSRQKRERDRKVNKYFFPFVCVFISGEKLLRSFMFPHLLSSFTAEKSVINRTRARNNRAYPRQGSFLKAKFIYFRFSSASFGEGFSPHCGSSHFGSTRRGGSRRRRRRKWGGRKGRRKCKHPGKGEEEEEEEEEEAAFSPVTQERKERLPFPYLTFYAVAWRAEGKRGRKTQRQKDMLMLKLSKRFTTKFLALFLIVLDETMVNPSLACRRCRLSHKQKREKERGGEENWAFSFLLASLRLQKTQKAEEQQAGRRPTYVLPRRSNHTGLQTHTRSAHIPFRSHVKGGTRLMAKVAGKKVWCKTHEKLHTYERTYCGEYPEGEITADLSQLFVKKRRNP